METSKPNREDLRDNPGKQWADLSKEPFHGRVAESHPSKSETMIVASGFMDNNFSQTISTDKWKRYFREKDAGTNKDLTYHEKVMGAIETWNAASPESRRSFLSSGEYNDEITPDVISILSGARIIDTREPLPTSTATHERNDPTPETPKTPKKPYSGFLERIHALLDPKLITPKKPEKPNKIEDPIIPEEPSKPKEPTEPTDVDKPKTPDQPIIFSEPEKPENPEEPKEPEEPEEPKEPEEPEEPKEPESPEGPTPPESPEPEPEDNPEGDAEDEERETTEETLQIIKQINKRELTPEEQAEIEKKAKEQKDKLSTLLRRGVGTALIIFSLFTIKPPHDEVEVPSSADVSTHTTEQTEEYTPSSSIEHEMTEAEREEWVYENINLGDEVPVKKGTVLHRTSEYKYLQEHGGIDRTVEVGNSPYRAEGNYTVDRVSFTGEDGKSIKSYHVENGDSGSIHDLIEQARQETGYEGNIYVHLHFDGPNESTPSGQTGWSENVDLNWVEEHTDLEVPTNSTVEIPESTKTVETEKDYSAEDQEIVDGNVEIQSEDGNSVTINIQNPDGSYRKAGDTVIGSDGRSYTIEEINVDESTTERKLNGMKLALDLGALGLGATGIYLLARKRRERNEGSDADIAGEAAEPQYETERELMDLTGEQLTRLTTIFSETAGDDAETIAAEFAEKAGIEPEPADETEDRTSTIFEGMTDAEATLAKSLLIKHDEATLRDLSERLGLDLEDFADRILNGEEDQTNEQEV